MQIGLEGLPRSGKSYSAVKEHLIPAMKAGRRVVTNIDGINHEAIAELTGRSLDEIRAFLIVITNEQVWLLHTLVKFGDLVIVDECHDFWPISRNALPKDHVEFFAMHGHFQIDIVLMTQVFSEVHRSVIARLERKNSYTKKSVVGKPNECHVNYYQKAAGSLKWVKINTGTFTYEKKYFPCYKGFADNPAGAQGGEGYQVYSSDEAVFWNKKMKIITGIVVIVLALATWKFITFFTANPIVEQAQKKTVGANPKPAQAAVSTSQNSTDREKGKEYRPTGSPADNFKFVQVDDDYIANLGKKYRIRLTGYSQDSESGRLVGFMEWRTDKDFLIERLPFIDLAQFGYRVRVSGNIAYLEKEGAKIMATMWPLADSDGPTQRVQRSIQQGSPPARASEQPPTTATGVIGVTTEPGVQPRYV